MANTRRQSNSQLTDAEIQSRLRSRGVQPTAQRIAICRCVLLIIEDAPT